MNFDAARLQIEARLQELRARHQRLDAHLKNTDRSVPDDSQDRAQFLGNEEVVGALDEDAVEEMGQLQVALARIQQGTYGRCETCGEVIPAARLQAIPAADRCISCASEAEGR